MNKMRMMRDKVPARFNALPLPLRSFDPANTVLLTGTPRSGTTWLGEVFAASPEHCLIMEPLDLKMPGLRAAGFSPRTYIDPGAEWPEGRAIFEDLFRGKGVTLKLLGRNRQKVLSAKGLVIKAIRANRLLPWLARHFAIRGMIHIIRHPCAVVSSQMAHPEMGVWDRVRSFDRQYIEHRLPDVLSFANTLKTEEEFRALTWCLDQHAPLAASDSSGWIRISYETLVAGGEAELRRLFSALGLTVPPKTVSLLRENSSQVQSFSVDHTQASVEERLGIWKRRLDRDQVARILAVVEACGISGFGDGVMPAADQIGVGLPIQPSS